MMYMCIYTFPSVFVLLILQVKASDLIYLNLSEFVCHLDSTLCSLFGAGIEYVKVYYKGRKIHAVYITMNVNC